MPSLASLQQALERANVEYAVIGAHAVNAWLEPRFTADFDITVQANAAALKRLEDELAKEGYRPDVHGAEQPSGPDFVRFIADDDSITRSIAGQPAHGKVASISQAAGTAVYEPTKGYTGADSFKFQASDGSDVPSSAATATIEDGLSPSCTLRSSRAGFKNVRRNKYTARFKCSEAGSLTLELLVKRGGAKRLGITSKTKYTRIGRASIKVKAAGSVKVKLKLTAKARKRLRKASKGKLLRLKVR